MRHREAKTWLLVLICVLAAFGLCLAGRIPQDPAYHQFADTRHIGGIDNAWNVVSNLPFLLVGTFGFWRYPRLAVPGTKSAYMLLCLGVLLVGFGSTYYHLAPSNASLLWDRLPMTIAFMALFSLLLDERVTNRFKHTSLWPLVALGVCSVLYWSWTQSQGRGDLRPYVLVQFLPIVLMPLVLWLFPARYLRSRLLLHAFAWYGLAKALEQFDHGVYQLTHVVGGHPLKHLVAALAVLCILRAVPLRSANN